MSSHFAPSVVGTISDLDGWSVQGSHDYSYPTLPQHSDADEFGFDPSPTGYPLKMEQTYSPPDEQDGFPDFSFDPVPKMDQQVKTEPFESRALTLDHLTSAIPNPGTAVARFGQVTPPRSNSESSVEKVTEARPARQRRATKTSVKDETTQSTQPGRKRRNTRKNSTATTGNPEEDEKRKQSLEKNRLAAAKCRVNKKEKTELLQRDSHEMAMTNAFLKEQIIRMKEEVQQMNALLLSHANCEGCKSPSDIQKHLNNLGNEFFAQHVQQVNPEPFNFTDMQLDHSEMEHESYFSPATDPSLMNPALPEFDRDPDFDVSTPLQTD